MRARGVPALALGLLWWAFGTATAEAADAAAGRQLAQRTCQTCHGIDGVGKMPNVPNIGGETEIYLTKQLKAFRAGERKDEMMSIVAAELTDTQIADVVAWYASIKFQVTMPADGQAPPSPAPSAPAPASP